MDEIFDDEEADEARKEEMRKMMTDYYEESIWFDETV